MVVSALSHFHGVTTKAEFACAAVRGFGANLVHAKRTEWQEYIAAVHPWEVERYLTTM